MTTEPEAEDIGDDIQDDTERYEAATREREAAEGDEGEEASENPWDRDENPYKAQAADKSKALASERRKRQESEKKRIELEERLEALESAVKRPRAVEEELPDENEDPIATIAALKRMIIEERKAKEADAQKSATQSKEHKVAQEFGSQLAELENDFRSETPDYDKAASHFAESLRAELEEQGYEGQGLDRAFGEHLVKISRRAIDAGKNPAEVIYALAGKRGYTLDKAQQKLQTIASSKKAGRSLSSAPTAPPTRELTYGYVASLKGPARDKAFAALREQERRKA